MLWLDALADVASILTLGVAVAFYAAGKRQAKAHLAAHLESLRPWCLGPHGTGWARPDITPANRLDWMHPRYSVLPQFSAEPIASLGLLQNVFIPEGLVAPIAQLNQSLQLFNARLSAIEELKRGDVTLFMRIGEKLSAGLKEVFGSDQPAPREATEAQLKDVLRRAKLDDLELRWVNVIGGSMETLHADFIGTHKTGRLAYHFARLQTAFDYWV